MINFKNKAPPPYDWQNGMAGRIMGGTDWRCSKHTNYGQNLSRHTEGSTDLGQAAGKLSSKGVKSRYHRGGVVQDGGDGPVALSLLSLHSRTRKEHKHLSEQIA